MYRGRRNEGYHSNGNRKQTRTEGREKKREEMREEKKRKGHIPKNDDSKGF